MRSVSMLSGAAMWWGTILCCSLVMVSVSRYGIRRIAGRRLPGGCEGSHWVMEQGPGVYGMADVLGLGK